MADGDGWDMEKSICGFLARPARPAPLTYLKDGVERVTRVQGFRRHDLDIHGRCSTVTLLLYHLLAERDRGEPRTQEDPPDVGTGPMYLTT